MHVHVNAAVSADGKLSSHRREQIAISGPTDFDRVDRIRAAADAVAVGVGTVLADDPHLTLDDEDRRVTRLRNGRPGRPARVAFDSRGRTPTDARILDDAAETHVVVADPADESAVARLRGAGATVHRTDGERVDLVAAVETLADEGIDRMLIEGGGEVIYSAFAAGVVDELTLFVGSLVIGGREAPTLADGEGFTDPDRFPTLALTDVDRLDDGVLLSYDVE
ncbi:MAG: 2,5-diamino-6-(ribosylamino)-4(3H)-pyrimidinone 5'-phosphate reductase [Halobaculum sp.]